MKNSLLPSALLAVALAAPGATATAAPVAAPSPVTFTQIRCERRVDPIGIDQPHPQLSWLLASTENNQIQTAYQVQAASSAERLNAGRADLWDSARTTSDVSIGVPYAGKALASRQIAYWRVRIWDRQGRASAWSAIGQWEMGLLSGKDWSAKWIGRKAQPIVPPDIDTGALRWIWAAVPAKAKPAANPDDLLWAYFRTSVVSPDPAALASAAAVIGANGRFHLYLNGERIHSGREGDHLHFLDLKSQLIKGKNVIAIAARTDGKDGRMVFQLRLQPAPGAKDPARLVSSDGKWRASREETYGWESPGFKDGSWKTTHEVGPFGVAPLDKVSATSLTSAEHEPASYLHRRVCITDPAKTPPGTAPVKARLYATALGLYDLFLNGRRVGDQLLAPGWTDYNKRIEYQTYDVTPLVDGPCYALAAVLGDGWYAGSVGYHKQRGLYGGYPLRLRAQLEVTWPDGHVDRVTSDGDWGAASGPIRRADLLDGETYDARREIPAWPEPGDVRDFQPVDVMSAPPAARLVAQAGPPVRVVSDEAPMTVVEPKPGRFVFDLKQNMVGFARLKVRGAAGTRVTLRFAEMLKPDGTIYTKNLGAADATDVYILRGEPGGEIWEPRFTTHGFRYIEVTGFPGKPSPSSLLVKVVQSDTRSTGRLDTSNELINKLQHNIIWGQKSNFVALPTDCPQRDERLGWMGDAQIFARTACFNADVANFFAKWLRDVYDDQDKDGGLADTVPYIENLGKRPGAPAWADAGIIVPWTMYQCYGDRRFIEEHFDGMKRHLDLIERSNPDLIWKNQVGNNYGDWLSINADTPKDLLGTAYFAHSAGLVGDMAAVLGRADDARKYRDLRKRITARFNQSFVKDDGRIDGDTQTAYLLALQFDLLSPDRRKQAEANLVAAIERANFHLSTGFLGVRELLPALTRMGRLDLAYRLLETDTFPSWGYSIKQGATTIWERWDGWTTDKGFQSEGMNSFNHYSLGSVGQWMYSDLGGLDLDPAQPAYKHSIIRPRPGGGLTSARARIDSLYGKVVSEWNIADGKFTLKATVPFNTHATVVLPDGKSHEVGSGEYTFTSALPPTP